LDLLGPGAGYPYLVAFPAVIVSGLVFNRGSAFLAVALSALLAASLSAAPGGGLHIPDRTDAVALARSASPPRPGWRSPPYSRWVPAGPSSRAAVGSTPGPRCC
jgi:hypothetical protein